MFVISVKINQADIKSLKEKGKDINATLLQRMRRAEFALERSLKESNIRVNIKTEAAGYSGFKTGKLGQAIKAGGNPTLTSENVVEGNVGVNRGSLMPYSAQTNWGGKISAGKTSTMLTVPFSGKKYPPAQVLRAAGLTFVRNNIIFLKTEGTKYKSTMRFGLNKGSSQKVIPVYALRKSVNQTGSKWIDKGVDGARPEVIGILEGSK